jgi:hypothetical protein
MHSTFIGIADKHVIALAKLRLTRARLTLACSTRQQAIGILRAITPAPRRKPQPRQSLTASMGN